MTSPMATDNSPFADILGSLPACRRCRANKRRCDTQLPACRNCAKAGVDCIFYDHVRKEDISRLYIASLVHALQQIEQPSSTPDVAHPKPSRYLGPDACLLQGQSLIDQGMKVPTEAVSDIAPPLSQGLSITPEIHHYLLELYIRRIHSTYPCLEITKPPFTASTSPTPWEEFLLYMVYAIACHCVDSDGYRILSRECCSRATEYLDASTEAINLATLQAITLLALYSFSDPQMGNVTQLLSFAGRIALDIERQGSAGQQSLLLRVRSTIYCLENHLSSTLDRPTFLPEPSEPLNFDLSDLSYTLCSLYRVQARFRRGDHTVIDILRQSVPVPDLSWQSIESSLHPNVLAVVYETYLLVQPGVWAASRLLAIYADAGYTCTFLTPQWAYKAGIILLNANRGGAECLDNVGLTQAYSNCMLVLQRCSPRWPSVGLLRQMVQGCLERRNMEAAGAGSVERGETI